MAILDIFKRKKIEEEKKGKIEKEVKSKITKKPPQKAKPKKVREEKPSRPISETERPKIKKEGKIIGEAWKILKTPHVTEKATDLVKKNQYVFKVYPKTSKVEIKKAVENLYGVDVISVKTIKIPRKQRKLGRKSGWRKGYKKAIVKIREGQKIEVLSR